MRVLGLDFETTWTQPVNTSVAMITEIGAILVEANDMNNPLAVQSQFLWSEDYPNSPQELVELTGLTDDILSEFGVHPAVALNTLLKLMGKADYIVAHNGNEFDKPLLMAECARHGLEMPSVPWLDTKTDVPYPNRIKTTKLSYLCAEHGFANAGAHRALFDTQAMLRLLSHYDLQTVISLSKEPTVYAVAQVSFQEKHLARDRGYFWNPDSKKWYKALKESAVQKERENCPFEIEIRETK